MSLFVSALKMLTVIFIGGLHQSVLFLLCQKDHSGPQNHWMSLLLLASHCRKQKGGWTIGYCFVFVD